MSADAGRFKPVDPPVTYGRTSHSRWRPANAVKHDQGYISPPINTLAHPSVSALKNSDTQGKLFVP